MPIFPEQNKKHGLSMPYMHFKPMYIKEDGCKFKRLHQYDAVHVHPVPCGQWTSSKKVGLG